MTGQVRRAAAATAAGALITIAGGIAGQAVRASTEVSDDLFRYPWSEEAFVPLTLLFAAAQALIIPGALALRRAGAGRRAVAVAVTGLAIFVVAELASIPVRDQMMDDTGAGVVNALFGVSTLVTGVGLTLAGRDVLAARVWDGWRRFTPLASGVWCLLIIGLVFSPVMQASIAVWGVIVLGLAAALATEPASARSAVFSI
jgi:hypothetical protein